MAQGIWYPKLRAIRPFAFKIITQDGHGTGFQIFTNEYGMCGIATAYHVIGQAHEWEQTIKIVHYESGKSKVLKANSRVIFAHPEEDLAFIVFEKDDLPLQEDVPALIAEKTNLLQGVEVGWFGFPSVEPNNLCFFAGHVSFFIKKLGSYLTDGVIIHGVSGGPAFYIKAETDMPTICGVITAYIPNRATGEALPGLGVIRSVEPYIQDLEHLKSVDAARKAKEKDERAKKLEDERENKPLVELNVPSEKKPERKPRRKTRKKTN